MQGTQPMIRELEAVTPEQRAACANGDHVAIPGSESYTSGPYCQHCRCAFLPRGK